MDGSRHGIDHDAAPTTNSIPPVFNVIGENRDDPDCLLLLGDDGEHYRYHLLDGTTDRADLDDQWLIDGAFAATERSDQTSV